MNGLYGSTSEINQNKTFDSKSNSVSDLIDTNCKLKCMHIMHIAYKQ